MVNMYTIAALAVSSFIGSAVAHPGDSAEVKAHERSLHNYAQAGARRAIAACAVSTNAAALKARSVARRAATAERLREKRGLSDSELS